MKRVSGISGLSVIGAVRLIIVVLLVAGFGVAQHDDESPRNTQGAIVALQGHGGGNQNPVAGQQRVDHTCSPVSVCVPILLASGAAPRATPLRPLPVSQSRVHQIDLWRARPASPIPIVAS